MQNIKAVHLASLLRILDAQSSDLVMDISYS
jgi:hypothetical protein